MNEYRLNRLYSLQIGEKCENFNQSNCTTQETLVWLSFIDVETNERLCEPLLMIQLPRNLLLPLKIYNTS